MAQGKRNREHGQQTHAPVADHAGAHDRGHIAPEAQNLKNKRTTIQTQNTHQAIHQECSPGEIAGVFDQTNQHIKERNQRHECDDGAHPQPEPFQQKPLQPGWTTQCLQPRLKQGCLHPIQSSAQQILKRCGEGIQQLKHRQHQQQKHPKTADGMEQYPVQRPGAAMHQGLRDLHKSVEKRLLKNLQRLIIRARSAQGGDARP